MIDTRILEIRNELREEEFSFLDEYQVLVLPENYSVESNEFIDTQDAIDFSKILKTKEIKCGNSFDIKMNSKTLERKGGDIWFGQILVIDSVILPTVISLIANYITNKLAIGTKTNVELTKKPRIDIELKFYENGKLNKLKYNGDGSTFNRILKQINVNETNKDK